MAAPTTKENPLIPQLRGRLEDLDLPKYMLEDMFLLRWLRARELNVDKAEDMLRKSLKWRKETDVEGILRWEPPKDFFTKFPYRIWGFDTADCPAGLLQFGEWDVRGDVVEAGRREDYLRYIDQLFEFVEYVLREKSRLEGKPITQFNIIVDMNNYSYRQIASIATAEVILESVRSFEANHPETLKAAYVINAPRIFSILFALVKPLLTVRTLSKVQIFSGSEDKWKSALLATFPSNQIPPKYGGTNTRVIEHFAQALNEYYDDFFGIGKSKRVNPEEGDDEDDSTEVTVAAGERLSLEFNVEEAGMCLGWECRVENYDIGFSVVRSGDSDELKAVPYRKVDAQTPYKGSLECSKPGKYIFQFDNSYSRMRPKTVHYSVTLTQPDLEDPEESSEL